jgi:putative addiction module killer protein
MDVKIYQDAHGNEPFENWLNSIRDKRTLARIDSRLRRVRLGNLGDHRSVGEGVFELRLDFGPGYRMYFARIGNEVILLLSGGDKSTQMRDIAQAKLYFSDYKDSTR